MKRRLYKVRTKKKVMIFLGILLLLIISTGGIAGNYMYNLALNPNTSKEKVFGKSNSTDEVSNWIIDESNYKDKFIKSGTINLHGYEIENSNKSNVWVVSVHGYNGNGSKMADYAKGFYDMGYNVLVPDLRGHGESEGNYIGMGWDDRLDILKWINLILEDHSDAEIILHGVSMGAATVMMTSGEQLPDNVKCIIEDCGYTSVWDEFSYQLKSLFNLPEVPVMQCADIVGRIRAGYWFSDASAIDQIKKCTSPMLFIHGDEDDFVPYDMLDKLYDEGTMEKEKVVFEGAEHAKSLKSNPDLYWKSVRDFINKYL